MKRFTILFFLFLIVLSNAVISQTIEVRVSAPEDDMEEYIAGPGQTKTLGTMDEGSSDLELGSEKANNVDHQLVGMRFKNIAINKGAIIKSAYIQFGVDDTKKNTDPCILYIYAEDNSNPVSYNTADPFNLSKRPLIKDSVLWTIPTGSWATVGEAGAAQKSADIKKLVQALVNRSDWASGNAMAFYIKGIGTREAYSNDGAADKAPLLMITLEGSSIDESFNTSGSRVNIYPIPANNLLNVELTINEVSDINVRISDINGKVLTTENQYNSLPGTYKFEINNNWDKGVYLITATVNGEVKTFKFIK